MDLPKIHAGGGYGSEFDYDSEVEKKKRKRQDLATKPTGTKSALPNKSEFRREYSKEEGRKQRFHYLSLDAYARHKQMVNDYLLYFAGARDLYKRSTDNDRTDLDVVRENHQFLWTGEEDTESDWSKRVAKKYWEKLFKEYTIAELSRYKENKIALRWRVQKEVVEGKGQFICGNKACDQREGLKSWEVNFGYLEKGQKKNALVKLRLCPDCSRKLNYHHKRREVSRAKRHESGSAQSPPPEKPAAAKKHKKQKHGKRRRHSSSSPDEGDSPREKPGTSQAGTSSGTSESEAWKGPAKVVDEKSREEEFEDYFEDMFL